MSILKAGSFPCDLSKRKCAYKGQLQRHLLEKHKVEQSTKVEEKLEKKKATIFPCTICERRCAYKKQLERHMLIHTVSTSEKVDEIALSQTKSPKQDEEITSNSEIKREINAERNPEAYLGDEMFVFETLQHKDTKSELVNVMDKNQEK